MLRINENKVLAEVLVLHLAEEDRVGKLTDKELVFEVLTKTGDHPCVTEMLNRFLPGWENMDWTTGGS